MSALVNASTAHSIFISGGAGFIGSHLLARLLDRPSLQRLVVFDNFSSGLESHLAPHAGDHRLEVVRADLKDFDSLAKAMQGCEVVFHLAANPDIARAVREPSIDFWEGTYLLQNVVEAMRVTGAKRILYTSGSGVYGENAEIAFREDHGPCVPISTYGASKLACEALIAAYCHMFGITARVFRFANVVGPRQTHGVGYDFLRRLRNDPTRLRVLGDGSQSKSYIHVADILDAVFLADTHDCGVYDVFNVATGDYITVREIADLALEVADLSNVALEFSGGDRGWKGDVPIVRFDTSKISALGWRCQRNSRAAMNAALQAMWKELGHE
jgi:UDP-glucose 4-epimerase